MPLFQKLIAYAVDLAIVGVLAGLVARRRSTSCYSFTSQLLAVLVSDTLILAWPGRFYTRDFWFMKDSFIHFLTFAVAAELAFRTFRGFPGALWTSKRVLLVIVALTVLVALDPFSPRSYDIDTLTGQVYSRLVNGSVWLFTAIGALILWYRLPVDPLHKAILIGFVPYLLVFNVALNAMASYGWDRVRLYMSYADTTAYLAVVAYWAYAAWHPGRVPVRAPEREPGYAIERSA
jgi:hypothetical protein